jgi:hypothetical protein
LGAIRANPDYAVAYANLGDVYAQLAARAYEKAVALDGSDRTLRAKLAAARELPTTIPKRPAKPPAEAGTSR